MYIYMFAYINYYWMHNQGAGAAFYYSSCAIIRIMDPLDGPGTWALIQWTRLHIYTDLTMQTIPSISEYAYVHILACAVLQICTNTHRYWLSMVFRFVLCTSKLHESMCTICMWIPRVLNRLNIRDYEILFCYWIRCIIIHSKCWKGLSG